MASDEDYMSFLDKANKDVSGGDGGGGGAKATSKQGGGGGHTFKTTDSGAEVPKEIKEATKDAFYVSDADEPFVTVSLKYDGPDGLPDEGMLYTPLTPLALFLYLQMLFYTSLSSLSFSPLSSIPVTLTIVPTVEFAKLINHWSPQDSDIEIQTPTDWDRQGQYTKLVKAVQRATKGNDVMVYKVPVDATRVEYWLVSSWEDRVIGVKALAVES